MNTRWIGLLLAPMLGFLSTENVSAQISRGSVREGLTLESKTLAAPVRYTVYLPFDYDSSQRHYPVVYLLHGYTDNDTGWLQFGEANLIADEAIANHSIPPMILVMPDGGASFYVNNHDGSLQYEDFFINEFIPFIESKFRVRAEKQFRGIAGLSMGGFGSLVHALRHPELFSACAAFSSAVYTDQEIIDQSDERWRQVYGPVYGPSLTGKERLTEHLKSYSPLHIIRTLSPDKIKQVKFYIDSGDDDFLYRGNATLHMALRELKVPHEFRVRDGGHTWAYWRTGLADALEFIGAGFHR